jgi:hypothetical protein
MINFPIKLKCLITSGLKMSLFFGNGQPLFLIVDTKIKNSSPVKTLTKIISLDNKSFGTILTFIALGISTELNK